MRVLLTGAAGFIGTRIGAQLSAAGHEVVGVDVMLPAAHGDGAQPPPDVRLLDVRDADAVAEVLRGVDVVCHQAAVVGAGVNLSLDDDGLCHAVEGGDLAELLGQGSAVQLPIVG